MIPSAALFVGLSAPIPKMTMDMQRVASNNIARVMKRKRGSTNQLEPRKRLGKKSHCKRQIVRYAHT